VAAEDVRRGGFLGNFSLVLLSMYERTGDAGLLDEAVLTARQAVAAAPADAANQANCLAGLGNSLRELAVRSADAGADLLAEAVPAHRDAAALTSPGSPGQARHLVGLGIALRHSHRQSGDTELLAEANRRRTLRIDKYARSRRANSLVCA
jgi:hypothetical protein